MLDRLQVLGRARPGVEPRLVTGCPVADQLHVSLGLVDLALHVGQGRARVDELRVQGPGLVLEGQDLLVLGQRGGCVPDLVQPRVDRLQVKQGELTGEVGFQDVPPAALAPTTNVQGSVRRVET